MWKLLKWVCRLDKYKEHITKSDFRNVEQNTIVLLNDWNHLHLITFSAPYEWSKHGRPTQTTTSYKALMTDEKQIWPTL